MVNFKNKYEEYKPHEGTYNKGDLKVDRSQAEDAEIYKCIEKYGITSLMRQSMAQEPLYLDNTQNLTLQEAVEMRKEMDDYFKTMPARARKVFGDSPEIFYQKYKNGDFNNFIETGALTKEQVLNLSGYTERKIEDESTKRNQNTQSDSNINAGNHKIGAGFVEDVNRDL